MAYTTPRTWTDDEVPDEVVMNTHIRDNLIALKDPPSSSYTMNQGSDYSTTSTSFTDIDATNLGLTITTAGGDVTVSINMSFEVGSANRWYLDVDVDGARTGGDDGIFVTQGIANPYSLSMNYTISGLTAGPHTFKLQWKTSGGTLILYAGAGTSGKDTHGQFRVIEG